jgi:hypothetical protein
MIPVTEAAVEGQESVFQPIGGSMTHVIGDALAGIAADIARELALEGRRQREAAQPLHFGAGADQRSIRIALMGAVVTAKFTADLAAARLAEG